MNSSSKTSQAPKKGLNISAKSFLAAIVVIFILMVVTYGLTLVIPGGEYARVENADGNLVIDTEGGFTPVEGGIPFHKWLLSPILVLGAEGNGALIAVIAFLLVIGGIFNALEKCGLIQYMLDRLSVRFGSMRYRLMAVMIFFFMALGSAIGSFEECVPLVPIVVALAIHLGWDALTGVSMSLLAVGCGFAAGVCNPFTVGVAQQLAGLPMFSGAWIRLVAFALIYCLLFGYIYFHAKKIERPAKEMTAEEKNSSEPKKKKGLLSFATILGAGILTILLSGFLPVLQDYTMIIVAATFLLGGIVATLISGIGVRKLGSSFFHGLVGILPAVLMILMASSIKYTMDEAKILDTLLHEVVNLASELSQWAVILFIYLIVLLMNFFIPSGSAKAFMLMPLILPIAQIFDISPQLCVLAFAFGDGFSNVFYPTNPALLISLGLADVSYGKWFRRTWKFQLMNFVLTAGILLLGLAIGYR